MTVINTNTSAILTANALSKNERAMSQTMERLSTGSRINSASDDAAGLAIASKMTSQINGLNMAIRNANDGISMVQSADGALVEVSSMFQRMRELAVQSSSDTNSTTDRSALNLEFKALQSEVQRISGNTQFNGMNILDDTVGTTGSVDFQVGANASQTITADFGNIGKDGSISVSTTSTTVQSVVVGTLADGDILTFKITNTNGSTDQYIQFTVDAADAVIANGTATTSMLTASDGTNTYTLAGTSTGGTLTMTSDNATLAVQEANLSRGISGTAANNDILTKTGASAAITAMTTAIASIDTQRATLGSYVNRLEYASDNLANVSQNASASRSRIQDADYAAETTELARTQIIQQAGTAMLSQANQQAQSVLALLK
jgi:flagellin